MKRKAILYELNTQNIRTQAVAEWIFPEGTEGMRYVPYDVLECYFKPGKQYDLDWEDVTD